MKRRTVLKAAAAAVVAPGVLVAGAPDELALAIAKLGMPMDHAKGYAANITRWLLNGEVDDTPLDVTLVTDPGATPRVLGWCSIERRDDGRWRVRVSKSRYLDSIAVADVSSKWSPRERFPLNGEPLTDKYDMG